MGGPPPAGPAPRRAAAHRDAGAAPPTGSALPSGSPPRAVHRPRPAHADSEGTNATRCAPPSSAPVTCGHRHRPDTLDHMHGRQLGRIQRSAPKAPRTKSLRDVRSPTGSDPGVRESDGFKRDAVDLVLTTGRPIAEVAAELGVYDSTLGNWVLLCRRRHNTPRY